MLGSKYQGLDFSLGNVLQSFSCAAGTMLRLQGPRTAPPAERWTRCGSGWACSGAVLVERGLASAGAQLRYAGGYPRLSGHACRARPGRAGELLVSADADDLLFGPQMR